MALKKVPRKKSRGVSVYDTKKKHMVGSLPVDNPPESFDNGKIPFEEEPLVPIGTCATMELETIKPEQREMLTNFNQEEEKDEATKREEQNRSAARRNIEKARRGTAWRGRHNRGSSPSLGPGIVVTTTFEPSPDVALELEQIGATPLTFHELSNNNFKSVEHFHKSISAAKDGTPGGACVHVYEMPEYGSMRLFITNDGQTGFAIKSDGDIVSVFNRNKGNRKATASILPLAVQLGGTKLDAFDTVLPKLYAPYGFVETDRLSWDDQYKPEGWNYSDFASFNNGRPDVVIFQWKESQVGKPHTPLVLSS